MNVPIALLLLVLPLAFWKIYVAGPYGTFHFALNVPPGTISNGRPETEWLNMGYWKDARSFPEACQALALRLLEAANCVPGGRVLDVGHACGDSLLLQMSHQNIPRPASLTGITKLPSHFLRSRDRIIREQSINPQSCDITLHCGDAVFHRGDGDHPLDPSSKTPAFSTIFALDCAYHFASRESFLRQSFVRLSSGGRIALADLVVSRPLPFGLRMLLSKTLSVRPENMVTSREYEAQLRAIGYINVESVDISDEVFPGFRTFLRSKGGLWRLFEFVIGWWVKAGGVFLIVSASKPAEFEEYSS